MPDERGSADELEARYYPNLIGRLYLISLEDVMGRNGVNALLNLAGTRHLVNNYPPNNLKREFPFSDLSAISKATETMYGPRGARGMELRAGRYAFNLGLKEFGPLLGMADLALKLMPMTMKMKIVLNATAQPSTASAINRRTSRSVKGNSSTLSINVRSAGVANRIVRSGTWRRASLKKR
jgi:hypothetical protein